MTTNKNKSTENTTNKQEDTQNEATSVNSPQLLAPRYLLPAVIDSESREMWSTKQIAAALVVGVLIIAIAALYIHGSSVAGV